MVKYDSYLNCMHRLGMNQDRPTSILPLQLDSSSDLSLILAVVLVLIHLYEVLVPWTGRLMKEASTYPYVLLLLEKGR